METQELDEKNIKALVSLLSDDDHEVLEHVEKQIITLGYPIIPFLEMEWESNFNPLVQKRIEDLIHTVQVGQLNARLIRWKNSIKRDLLEGMWIVCTYHYPDVELEKLQSDINHIYLEVKADFNPDFVIPADIVKSFNAVFFNKLKFKANTKNFHAVSNSMINLVLDTRKGNPISLCVIYMLVAQKLNLPIYGVNLPNLFILTYKVSNFQLYINAFNNGLIFTRADIDNYIAHLNITPNDLFYQPCTNLDVMRRVLRNIIVSFEKTGDQEKVNEVKALLEILLDETDSGI